MSGYFLATKKNEELLLNIQRNPPQYRMTSIFKNVLMHLCIGMTFGIILRVRSASRPTKEATELKGYALLSGVLEPEFKKIKGIGDGRQGSLAVESLASYCMVLLPQHLFFSSK